jgi:retinol dehydrogenase 12
LVLNSAYERSGNYTNDAARIDGKVVIVTGANTGLGKATAVELAKRGGKVYIACRSEERAKAALVEIQEKSGSQNVHYIQLDLASLESIRNFSRKFHEIESRLDILVNNAGLLTGEGKTADGFDMTVGVNHLGVFLLTNLLLDLLKAAAPSRVVIVASDMHNLGSIDKENFNHQKKFPGTWFAYANSKLANVLFARELAKKLEGTGVTVNACCPGPVNTEVARNLGPIGK